MAIQAEVLEAEVRVRMDKAEADLKRLEARLDATGNSAQKAGRKAEQGGRAFSGMSSLVKVAAGGMVVALGKKVIGAASDLNEQLSKTGVVFGPQADQVVAAADKMAKQFGINKTVYLEAAGGLGLIAKASGLTQSKSAVLANQFAKLAADASSFYNVPIADALTAMKSGLVGESEPMRQFGVLLNETTVANEAVRLGLAKNTKNLTDGMKVQARASLIIKGMKDASGDLARTQSGVANRLREVQGRAENYAAAVGMKALPLTADFLELLVDKAPVAMHAMEQGWVTVSASAKAFWVILKPVAQAVDSLPGPIKGNALALGIMALAFNRLVPSIAANRAALTGWTTQVTTATGRQALMSKTMTGIGGAARGLAGAGGLVLLSKGMNETNASVGTLMSTLGGAATGFAVGGPVGAAVGGLAGLFMGLSHNTDRAKAAAAQADQVWKSYKDTLDGTTAAVTAATRAHAQDMIQQKGLNKTLGTYGYTNRQIVNAITKGGPVRDRMVKSLQAEYKATSDTAQAIIDKHGTSSREYSDYVKANKARQDAVAAALDELGAVSKATKAKLADISATRTFSKAVKSLPRRVQTAIETQGLEPTNNALVNLKRQYKELDRKDIALLIRENGGTPTKHTIDVIMARAKALGALKPTVTPKVNPKPANHTLDGLITSLTGQAAGSHPTVTPRVNPAPARHTFSQFLASITGRSVTVGVGAKPSTSLSGILGGGSAGGSTVQGSRHPYGDKVLMPVAPGEEIISNRHGQADRNRSLLKFINRGGMANGGTVGMASGGTAPKIHGTMVSGADVLAAFRASLLPAIHVLRRMEKLARDNTSGTKEKHLLAYLQKQDDRAQHLERRRRVIDTQLASVRTRRDNLVQAKSSFREAVTGGISSQANVLNAGNNAGTIASSLSSQVTKARQFAWYLKRLKSMGYSRAIIMQVASAGIEGGLETAKALAAASPSERKSINSSFAKINAVANQQGKILSAQMYDAGIHSANGVIKGLNAKRKAIENTLEIIARGMVKALRTALGIHSPSSVFRAEMGHVGDGLVLGARDQQKRTMAATRDLAQAAIHGFGSGRSALTPAALGQVGNAAAVHLEFKTYNPVAEPQSRTTNKALDRVAAIGLV